MDVRTSIKGRLPSRRLTAGRSTNAALHQSLALECGVTFDPAEIFKKPSCVADLKPRGRDVAKDVSEFTAIPPLLHTLFGYDADIGTLNVKLTDAELAERKTKWMPRTTNPASGALGKHAQPIGPAVDGAVTHPGGAHEKQCYADI